MDLIAQLNTLGRRVNRCYPTINNGGCCVYAVLVCKELKKLKVRTSIIVAGYNGELNVQQARKNIKNIADHREWWDNGVYFNHVGIEFTYKGKKYHYDSNGVKLAGDNLMNFPLYKGKMRLKWAETLANQAGSWNHMFNRDKIPTLTKKVETFMDPNSSVFKKWLTTQLP